MRFITIRELRNWPGRVWDELDRDDLVLTANGKPMAVLVRVEGDPGETLQVLQRTRAALALSRLRRQASLSGVSRLKRGVVEAEIGAARKARR
jgi:hypothetical protein